uniref:Uncharacterized protein n=1 Tax=Rhabditophanes sp. KR3021 TaxID=114890 RepID=A0AC35U939_9BILA
MSNKQNNNPSPFSPIPNAGYGCDYCSDYTQATVKDNECLVYYEENRDHSRGNDLKIVLKDGFLMTSKERLLLGVAPTVVSSYQIQISIKLNAGH